MVSPLEVSYEAGTLSRSLVELFQLFDERLAHKHIVLVAAVLIRLEVQIQAHDGYAVRFEGSQRHQAIIQGGIKLWTCFRHAGTGCNHHSLQAPQSGFRGAQARAVWVAAIGRPRFSSRTTAATSRHPAMEYGTHVMTPGS